MLLFSLMVQDTDGLAALPAGAKLETSAVFRLVDSGDIQSGQVEGKTLLVIIFSETAHGSQELVQACEINVRP